MILAALLACAGATELLRVNMPGLNVSPPNPLTGQRAMSAVAADMNGDGRTDLLLPTRCYFQRDNGYPLSDSEFLPDYREQPRGDIYKNELILLYPGAAKGFRWENGHWNETFSAEISWTEGAYDAPPTEDEGLRGIRFTRFLHDLNADGAPEFVFINGEGIYIYGRQGNTIERERIIRILPEMSFDTTAPTHTHWGAGAQRFGFPIRSYACRVVIQDTSIDVITDRAMLPESARYNLTQYELQNESVRENRTYAPVPAHLQPCRLNGDSTLDFAGTDWQLSDASATPVPILTTSASLDGGRTVDSIRTHGFRPQVSFADIDSDGDHDMIAPSLPDLSRAIHGAWMRRMTSRRIQQDVQIHLQSEGRFNATPSYTATMEIRLEQAPYQNGPQFRHLREGRAFDLTGDYDGDGYNDLLVHETVNRIVIYRNEGDKFGTRPMLQFEIEPESEIAPIDVDRDGRTDIVITTPSENNGLSLAYVLFSRDMPQ